MPDLPGLSDVEIMDRADTLHDAIAVMLAGIVLSLAASRAGLALLRALRR